jgi:hypothetical protein
VMESSLRQRSSAEVSTRAHALSRGRACAHPGEPVR